VVVEQLRWRQRGVGNGDTLGVPEGVRHGGEVLTGAEAAARPRWRARVRRRLDRALRRQEDFAEAEPVGAEKSPRRSA